MAFIIIIMMRLLKSSNSLIYIGGVLLMSLMIRSWSLTWQDYARIFVIDIGLAYLVWGSYRKNTWVRGLNIIAALIFIFILVGFNTRFGSSGLSFWVDVICLTMTFCLAMGWFIISDAWRLELRWPDKIVFVFGCAVLGLQLYGNSGDFTYCVFLSFIFITSGLIWLLFKKEFIGLEKLQKLLFITIGVFGTIILIGSVRLGVLYNLMQTADEFRMTSEYDAAAGYYLRAEELSRALGFRKFSNEATFNRASIFHKQGNTELAAKTLGLEDGLHKTINFLDLSGPAKGDLYTEATCWSEIKLYPGRVNLCVNAKGTYALGEWPVMRVRFEDVLARDVTVSSEDLSAYCFEFETTGRQGILSISFINDGYSPPLEDRNLWVESVRIFYKDVFWK